eukprot:7141997-Prymnesium_polylepis.1
MTLYSLQHQAVIHMRHCKSHWVESEIQQKGRWARARARHTVSRPLPKRPPPCVAATQTLSFAVLGGRKDRPQIPGN